MKITEKLQQRWEGVTTPFLIGDKETLVFSEILNQPLPNLSFIQAGDVVALIGDFDALSLHIFLKLIEKNSIVIPLTRESVNDHPYFFNEGNVRYIIEGYDVLSREIREIHPLVYSLKQKNNAGLILFSTGTTGRPKAILHDLSAFLRRYETPRPSLRTMSFLLFDHIGGINTILHTLYNCGTVVVPISRKVQDVLLSISQHNVEVLPTTPTFLRMLLMSGLVPDHVPECLKVITYGTERMDQPTLDSLCDLLPQIEFRQTFGMSELGIVRVKSKERNSLLMRIGGEGVNIRVIDGVLHINSNTRMVGYLNAPSPFDEDGWYNTRDIVIESEDYIQVVGRTSDVINVGGLKFMASDVERIALQFPGITHVKVHARNNPITGQHVELVVQPQKKEDFDKVQLTNYLKSRLQNHMVPRRICIDEISITHRFKRS